MKRRRILIYSGKSPETGQDIDGGSIMLSQLLETLKYNNDIDLILKRGSNHSFDDRFIKSINYIYEGPSLLGKFEQRINNEYLNSYAFKNYEVYDIIIVLHISLLFGLNEFDNEFWNKVVLFPMFCTPSYTRSGEPVPTLYTDMERLAIERVNKIISPSNAEKKSLTEFYNISQDRITVIPRGINPAFFPSAKKSCSPNHNIVYIASIKKQKDNIRAVELLDIVRGTGINAKMHLICTIQDRELYADLLESIEEKGLSPYVQFHFEISQAQEAQILREMDINISVSRYETFGRGIFEGISAGLPTFVLDSLDCVKEICGNVSGISYSHDINKMANDIQYVINSPVEYAKRKDSLKQVAENVSYYKEQIRLKEAILEDKIGSLEYIGVNVSLTGCKLEEKRYYHYNGINGPKLPDDISCCLKPFDIGIRSQDESSISYFIKNADICILKSIINHANINYGIVVDVDGFAELFSDISRFGEGIHYDPVLSIKSKNDDISDISFYVTTVINKQDCFEFWEQSSKCLCLDKSLRELITKLILSRCVLMFQLSWDFSPKGLKHNKLYLKIKNMDIFIQIMADYYPDIQKYYEYPSVRFCEIAFVINNSKLEHFNLYYKPL